MFLVDMHAVRRTGAIEATMSTEHKAQRASRKERTSMTEARAAENRADQGRTEQGRTDQAVQRQTTPGAALSAGRIVDADGKGKTHIANGVVAKIAGIAAREIEGVHELSSSGLSNLATRITRGDTRATGVSVEVGEREAAVDLAAVMEYGVSIPQVAEAVRRNVMDRIHEMTGLLVKEVNIDVSDLYFPEDEATSQPRVQ